MAGRPEGKVAVITGGASGIGAATVRRFVEEGARVLLADLQEAKAEALVASLERRALHHHTDVSEEQDVERPLERALSEFRGLDFLFNNAGFDGAVGPIESIPVPEYDRTLDVLLRAWRRGSRSGARVCPRTSRMPRSGWRATRRGS